MPIDNGKSKAGDTLRPEMIFLERAKAFTALGKFDAMALESHIKTELKPGFTIDERQYSFSSLVSLIILRAPNQETALNLLSAIHQIDNSLLSKVATTGAPILERAVARGYFDVVTFFTDKVNISIDESGAAQLSALYCIVTDKMLSVSAIQDKVEFLVKEGANPLFKDKKGQCPLSLTQSEVLLKIMRQSTKWADEIKEYEIEQEPEISRTAPDSPKGFYAKPDTQSTSYYVLKFFGYFTNKEKKPPETYQRLSQEESNRPAHSKKTN